MANRYYSNTAVATTITGAINNTATTIPVAATTGYPVSYPFTAVIDSGTASEELVTVTGAAGLNLTVTRGSDGTSAVSHSSGASFKHVLSAQDVREPQDHMASTAAHGATGAVMGTTNTQTVTNKDLTSSTNTFGPAALNPTGAMLAWPTASAPSGWLICDGSAVSRTTYATLFALIGTTFGAGDGSTTFNLPNLVDRVPIGKSGTKALASTGGSADAVVVSHNHGATAGGMDTDHGHSFTTGGESNDHVHGLGISDAGGLGGGGSLVRKGGVAGDNSGGRSAGHTHSGSTGGASAGHSHGITVNTTGSSGTNANLPPYLALNWIIKT